jgi:SulP family sulfate permease
VSPRRPKFTVRRAFRLTTGFIKSRQLSFFTLGKRLKGYRGKDFASDCRAGVNDSLFAFPQTIAYALIAGLPVYFGIIGAVTAAMIGPFLTSSRFISFGPSNATSVLLLSSFLALQIPEEMKPLIVPTLVLLVGIFLLLGSLLHIANLVQYVSRSVIVGYLTAAATLIIANQVRVLFGITTGSGGSLINVVTSTLSGLHTLHLPSLGLGLATFAIYYFLGKAARGLPRVAVTLVLATLLAWSLTPFDLGFAYVRSFTFGDITFLNYDFSPELISRVASVSLALAFLITLEFSSIGKSLAARSGERLNPNQQMLAFGIANIANSASSGMAASSSLTRSTLNFNSGAKTPLAGMISALLIIFLLLVVKDYISLIPRPALAAVIITIGLSLFNLKQIKTVIRSTPSDATVFFGTVGAGLLFPLDTAIYFGAGLSIFLFLRKASVPELVEFSFTDAGDMVQARKNAENTIPDISIVHVEGDLFFGAADIFEDQIRQLCSDPNLKVIILRLRNAHNLDATSVMALEELVDFARQRDREIIVSNARRDVYKVFRNSGLLAKLGRENFIMESFENPNLANRKALLRAQALIGARTANIRILAKPKTP